MKKEYKPLPMVMNGRYAVLYGKLPQDVQTDVLSRMASLIEEEREYEDKGNYSHLCNILTTIALDEALQAHGTSAEESYRLISEHMWAALTPDAFRRFSRLPFFLPLMKKIVPVGFRKGSGKGWQYRWHDDDPRDSFRFETLQCLYHYQFSKRNLLERFGPMFCHSDVINYGSLHNIDFIRTGTLCQGDSLCDFCFVRHRKPS